MLSCLKNFADSKLLKENLELKAEIEHWKAAINQSVKCEVGYEAVTTFPLSPNQGVTTVSFSVSGRDWNKLKVSDNWRSFVSALEDAQNSKELAYRIDP